MHSRKPSHTDQSLKEDSGPGVQRIHAGRILNVASGPGAQRFHTGRFVCLKGIRTGRTLIENLNKFPGRANSDSMRAGFF